MDNENFSGEWTGHFRQIENGTEIIFTEAIKTEKMVVISFCMVLFENTAETVYSRPEKKM